MENEISWCLRHELNKYSPKQIWQIKIQALNKLNSKTKNLQPKNAINT